jgi:hypothetical protein
MKVSTAALLLLALVGCWYDAPLTEEHRISIDPSILGKWEIAEDEAQGPEPKDTIMILKFSDTEYMIHYIATADARYYRGYPIEMGGVSCVQLQVIGTPEGLPERDAKPFFVVSYQRRGGDLVVKLLNTDLIDNALTESDALRQAFLVHKEDPDLFRDPGRFQRVEKN